MDERTYRFNPHMLTQRGMLHFDARAPQNPAIDADGRTPPPQFQPGKAEQVVAPKEGAAAKTNPKADEAARRREIAEGVKSQSREERAARWAKDLDEDPELEQLVNSRRTKAAAGGNTEELQRKIDDLTRDRAIRDLAEEYELTGEDAKRFRKLLSRYEIDELESEAKDIAELIQGASAKGKRRNDDDDDDDRGSRSTRSRASTAVVPSRDGNDGARANETEEQRLEREFRELSKQEARARERR